MNVRAEIKRLNAMPIPQLRAEFERVWGEPARSNNRVFLLKRIVWRMQAAEQGGLSERAVRRATELARDQELRIRPPAEFHREFASSASQPSEPKAATLEPGEVLSRMYRGRRIEVKVRDGGFECDGVTYASLTAVARAVTGSEWNGRLFFGLTTRKATA